MGALTKVVPALEWIATYRRADLRGDLTSGVIVAIMLIPQGMAYAMLAGLPPVMGLYAATAPLIAYVLLGSSRQLAVGPVAMMSLLVFAGCSSLAPPGSADYVASATLLALMVGIGQVALGVFRMGFLVNFVSHAVISGFTSASAIVICISQLKHLLGIDLPAGHSVFPILLEAGRRIGETNPYALAIGLVSIAALAAFRRKAPHFPAAILVVVGGTLLVYVFHLREMGVKTVGAVPQGLPGLSLPVLDFATIRSLVPTALVILFVGYMESISVARWIAARECYDVSPNREFVGLGLANVAASLVSGYPVTGGFSRTAVNYQAGARTGLASVITAVLVMLTLLVLTPLFYYLPNAVLAAIIMVAVIGLIDIAEAKRLFALKKTDGGVLTLTFIATLTIGLEQGILSGVGLSLLLFIWRSAHPHTAELGYLEDEGVFRNLDRFPQAKTFPGVLMLRVDASLYFANMGFIENLLRKRLEEKPETKCVLFDLSGVNAMDAVAVRALERIMEDYAARQIAFAFAAMKGPVRDLVSRAGWQEKYPESQYTSLHQALDAITGASGSARPVSKSSSRDI